MTLLANELFSARWTIGIIQTLLDGPARFSRLKRALPGVSSNILAARLRHLEAAQMVERVQLVEPSDRQVYRLTPRGAAARAIVEAIAQWAIGHGSDDCAQADPTG